MKSYVLPPAALSWVRWLRWRIFSRPPGQVRFGDLRRPRPLAPGFGRTRGGPIDRYYIEAFLDRHATDIRGRTLEIGDDTYTLRFGGGRVTRSDVLHVKTGNPLATIVADLARGDNLPSDAFGSIILTQTLHMIYDYRAVLQTVHRILKPGGVVLLTTPGITKTDQGRVAVVLGVHGAIHAPPDGRAVPSRSGDRGKPRQCARRGQLPAWPRCG
jgi:SAM-dependent methyltransferase